MFVRFVRGFMKIFVWFKGVVMVLLVVGIGIIFVVGVY